MTSRLLRLACSFALLLAAAVTSGPAIAQISDNVIFHGNLDEHVEYNDIWGYTAPNGDEYALLGTTTGLSVINVTDRGNPYETGYISGVTSVWRDIKTYDHYAYVTTEGIGGGLMIVDLDDPENPVQMPTYNGFSTAHNIYIDTATARCYIAGSDLGSGGLRILSLANPIAPTEIGSWETVYLHDVMVQDGKAFCGAIYQERLYILDVTGPGGTPSVLGQVGGYPHAFTHNGWVTPDGNYVLSTDEEAGAACRMWDITNLPTITQTDLYLPNPSTVPHNAHIVGDLAVISHYEIGVRIVDVSDPFNLAEVGYYDTYPSDDGGGTKGCWGAYPFFENSPGLIVASDIQTGLYVLEYTGALGTVAGAVTDAQAVGVAIEGATVEVVESGLSTTTDAAGGYSMQDSAGGRTLRVSALAYVTQDVPVPISPGSVVSVDVALDQGPGSSLGGFVSVSGGGPIAGASIVVAGTPLAVFSDGAGNYDHPIVPVGTHTVSVSAFGYNTLEATVTIVDGGALTQDFALMPAPGADDFESADASWTVSGPATTGQWERADPQPTEGGTVQSGDDHTPAPGVNAWITGPLAGTSVGSHDVDGGATRLTSPVFDLTGLNDPYVSYFRWYVTGTAGGNTTTDFWTVEMSTNAGSSWTDLESTETATAAWLPLEFRIADYGTPTSAVQFRFTAQDTGAGSITEAGLDDFMVFDILPSTGTGIGSPGESATLAFDLGRSFPNPFRVGLPTTLAYTLPQAGPAEAAVYDVGGRRVAILADGILEKGHGVLKWDGRATSGKLVPAGVYFVKLSTESGDLTRKAILLR